MPKRAKGAEDLSGKARHCREFGHHWKWKHDFAIVYDAKNRPIEATRWLNCGSCGTERKDVIEIPSFRLVSRSYEYPDHYLVVKWLRITREDLLRIDIGVWLGSTIGGVDVRL